MSVNMGTSVPLTPLNPLSIPRGVRLVDELTGEPAKFVATLDGTCFYYSSPQSFQLDYDGVLEKIYGHLSRLAVLGNASGTAAERAANAKKIKQLQKEIADICERTAQEHLIAKDFELAVPPALRSLRTLISLYGESTLELVPAYLVLAEVNLGLSRVTQAEEFLSTASYILVKQQPTPTDAVTTAGTSPAPSSLSLLRSRLHRNFGRLYAAQGNNSGALDAFSRDIYFSSMLQGGPESVDVSIGYFFMAQVLAAQGQMESSLVFFDRVVDCWYRHLQADRSAISVALGIDFNKRGPEQYFGDARATALALRSKALEEGKMVPVEAAALAAGATPQAAVAAALAAGGGSGSSDGTSKPAPLVPTEPVPLTETQVREGSEMLEFITHVRATQLGPHHVSTAEARYTHALVLLQAPRRQEEARHLLSDALVIFGMSLVSRTSRQANESQSGNFNPSKTKQSTRHKAAVGQPSRSPRRLLRRSSLFFSRPSFIFTFSFPLLPFSIARSLVCGWCSPRTTPPSSKSEICWRGRRGTPIRKLKPDSHHSRRLIDRLPCFLPSSSFSCLRLVVEQCWR